MLEVLKKILKIIVNVLTIIIFGVLILIIFAKVNMVLTGKQYFDFFGYSIFKVTTGSMEPTIKENDIIIVKEKSNYNINDIITYESDNAYITHRIVQIYNDQIVTKGDANNAIDTAINKNVIIGAVVKNYSGLGIWQDILTTPKIIISIFATLMLFDFAFSYKGKKNKNKEQNLETIKDKINVPLLKQIQGNNDNISKLNDSELEELCNKLNALKDAKKDIKLDNKEKELLDYTVRLDLTELQKEINDKINKN